MSAAGEADVLCDWEKTLPFRDSSFDQVRMIHIIEESGHTFPGCSPKPTASQNPAPSLRSLRRTTQITLPLTAARRIAGISPVFHSGFSATKPAEYDYYAPANYKRAPR